MRIYCLSKVEEISPKKDVAENIEPYEDGADEITIKLLEEHQIPTKIKKYIGRSQFYGLTEISIGYLETQHRKIFVMYIYRNGFGIHQIRMIRGAVRLEQVSEDVYDLYIANSKLYPSILKHDLQIRLRCIKNTSTKGIISEEEEALYYEYEKQILEYCDLQPELQEEVFDKFEFTKHNTSTKKVFKERIRNLNELINLLCDPKTGRYLNVPTSDSRLYQEVENLLYQKSSWNVRKPRQKALDNQAKNFRDCTLINWLKADLDKLTFKDVNTKKLRTLYFEEVNFFNSKGKIQPCLKYFDFSNLETLSLWRCKIVQLSDEFFEKLPETLLNLDVRENRIVKISEKISKLINLKKLNLYNNLNLSDTGIPWEKLPTKIGDLNLGFTNITQIPSNIKRLTALVTLNVSSQKLTYVDWKSINSTIEWLHIEGGGKMNDVDLSGKNCLQRLDISYAGLTNVDCSFLPPCLDELLLCNNKLQNFDPGRNLPNLSQLVLSDNELKKIEWKNISSTVNYLTLDNNQLTCIENISHLTNLMELTVKFNQISSISTEIQFLKRLIIFEATKNQISELPIGFEKLKSLKFLDLSQNHFNYLQKDLEKVLWERLPRQNFIECIYLNKNTLGALPCLLKEIPIENLHVEDCKIKYMCPKIFSKLKNLQNSPHLNLRFNPIHFLPFIPQEILQPSSREPPTNDMYPLGFNESPRFHLRMEDERFVVTSKFPMAFKKPKYDFKIFDAKMNTDEKEPNFCCKCCAKCGKKSENAINHSSLIIEQLMVMDYTLSFDLVINEKPRIIAGVKKKSKELLKAENQDVVTTKQKFYCPGKWKTTVITRLCEDCIILMKSEIDKAFEIHKSGPTPDDMISQKRIKEDEEEKQETANESMIYPSLDNNATAPSGLLLSNESAVDCFLNVAVNAIATMENFKDSICANIEFSEYNSTHRKLVEVLQHQVSHVRDLRQTLQSFHGNQQEDAVEAFLQLINSIDNQSKKFINFSYKTIIDCSCRQTIRECNECAILNLTVTTTPNSSPFVNTFNSMLEQWQSQNVRCSNCYKMGISKHWVEINFEQEYLVVEINSWIKKEQSNLQISISTENFCAEMQEIFGNLWELIGAIQYIGTGAVGHYLYWKRSNNGKIWEVINDDKRSYANQILPDLKHYKILIFKKFPPLDIDFCDFTVEENEPDFSNAIHQGVVMPSEDVVPLPPQNYAIYSSQPIYSEPLNHTVTVQEQFENVPQMPYIDYGNAQYNAPYQQNFVDDDNIYQMSSQLHQYQHFPPIVIEQNNILPHQNIYQYQQSQQRPDQIQQEFSQYYPTSIQQTLNQQLQGEYTSADSQHPHQYIPQNLQPLNDQSISTQNDPTQMPTMLETFNFPTSEEQRNERWQGKDL